MECAQKVKKIENLEIEQSDALSHTYIFGRYLNSSYEIRGVPIVECQSADRSNSQQMSTMNTWSNISDKYTTALSFTILRHINSNENWKF